MEIKMFPPVLLRSLSIALAASAVTAAVAIGAPARERQEIGTLRCRISGGLGMVITSKKALSCNFERSGGGRPDTYVGTITKYGLDVGVTGKGEMVWLVYRAGSIPRHGYGGIGTDASVGVGLGANALIGGSDRSVSLQPFSGQAQEGVNIALGVAELSLQRAR
jgi:hypothetical protein